MRSCFGERFFSFLNFFSFPSFKLAPKKKNSIRHGEGSRYSGIQASTFFVDSLHLYIAPRTDWERDKKY